MYSSAESLVESRCKRLDRPGLLDISGCNII